MFAHLVIEKACVCLYQGGERKKQFVDNVRRGQQLSDLDNVLGDVDELLDDVGNLWDDLGSILVDILR